MLWKYLFGASLFSQWIAEHWFDLLQSIGIVGGLVFTAYSMRQVNKAQRVANLLQIAQGHREIWLNVLEKPELVRVLDPLPDIATAPVTTEERIFVRLLIVHLSATVESQRADNLAPIGELRQDIIDFFSLPIPYTIWLEVRQYQNKRLVALVESLVSTPPIPCVPPNSGPVVSPTSTKTVRSGVNEILSPLK